MNTKLRKPHRHCRGIMPQFADKILSGEKTTTIRPDAKNMREGDLISFWVGWRKKNPIYICTAEIISISRICIIEKAICEPEFISTIRNEAWHNNQYAVKDGFASFEDMISFFKANYPPKKNELWKFNGKLITFGNIRVESERYLKK